MRILRIFKLVRHFAGLQSLFYTLQQAYQVHVCFDFLGITGKPSKAYLEICAPFFYIFLQELGLLVLVVLVAILTYSSLVCH